ncbi:DNA polymerase III subunit alpha [candidate division GN15 bacterium]|nr:DNA polymerase III subunit alpha [candidate division GN15 bacterium]
MTYVELHCHSNFSFLDGASHPEELVARAAELGYPALAITDHNGLYGAVRFHQAARDHGIKPIIGAEITLDNDTDNDHHLTLLAIDYRGYANLSQMLAAAQLANEKNNARVTREMLYRHHEGLIALSGCPEGEIPAALLDGDTQRAERIAEQYRELFGADNFYLELQHHHQPRHHRMCESIISLGRKLDIPLVATNNVHYHTVERRPLQDVLTCIRHRTNLDSAGTLLYPNAERYLKSADEMAARFAHCPGVIADAIANTVAIAERCWFRMEELQTSLPDFPVPDGYTPRSYLRHLTYLGAQDRYGKLTEEIVNQIEHELRLINKLDLAGYFLIVWDICRFARDNGILSQGRGSAANSAVCYCLGVTAVDPIGLDLLFERFLSEQRTEPPDIDIDIHHQRREEVIQYVYEKYGREHAAMVCEVISYRGRSAVRDVGKALGFSLPEVDQLAKLHDHFSSGADTQERIVEAGFNPDDKRVKLLAALCADIHRFPRHLGIHVGGMIVTKAPLSTIVPIENATMPDRSVIQWDKDDAEAMRLVKIDLLGLGMLTCIDLAFQIITKHHGVTLDMAKMSYDDPVVFDLLCSADTVGVFQVESRAQMNALPRHKPRRFYDLVIEVALIRPGPIQGDMVHPYLRRRNGEEEVTYPHPSLRPILERTLGVPLFQEQGMKVAMHSAGFSPTEADELRRAMGHKRSAEKMENLRARLVAGMVRNGIDEDAALRIFKQLAAFADFGFAESHAASFALLVYVSSFIKVYYPEAFYCAMLNAQPLGFYSPSTIIYEARHRGVKFLNVDIAHSEWDCTIEEYSAKKNGSKEGKAVRLGMRYIKSMGPAAQEKIEAALKDGPFRSVADFVFRTGLDKNNLEQMALVGAFRSFGITRRQALWEVLALENIGPDELAVRPTESGHRLLNPMVTGEQLAADFKGMDLSLGPHPMQLVRRSLRGQGILSAGDLKRTRDGQVVEIAGMVIIRQRPMTAKGFMFLTMEDETGFANIVVKPNFVSHCRKAIVYSAGLLVRGVVERKDGVINVIGYTFTPLRLSKDGIALKSRDFR